MENTYIPDTSLPLGFDEELDLIIAESAEPEKTFLQVLNDFVSQKKVGNNQLSALTGIDKSEISRYLNGERQVNKKHLCLICIALRLMTCYQKKLFDLLKEPMPCSIGKPTTQELIVKHCMDGCFYNPKYTVAYCYRLLDAAEKRKTADLTSGTEGGK